MNEELKRYINLISEENDPLKKRNLIKEVRSTLSKHKEYILKKQQEVLRVIDIIKEEYNKNEMGYAQTEFKEGGCYYLAIMLKRIFKDEATIYITEREEIHAIVKIENTYYDIDGIKDPILNDLTYYYQPTEEEFLSFMDKCNIGCSKASINIFENKCNKILKKILSKKQGE